MNQPAASQPDPERKETTQSMRPAVTSGAGSPEDRAASKACVPALPEPAAGQGQPTGSDRAHDTFPYRQSTNFACPVGAVRNIEAVLCGLSGYSGCGVRTETEVAAIMSAKLGRSLEKTFAQNGGGIDVKRGDPFLEAFNAGLNPIGLCMGKAIEYAGVEQFAQLMADAATTSTIYVAATVLEGTDPIPLSQPNHVVVLVPYRRQDSNETGNPRIVVFEIDSGTPNNGQATLRILTTAQAANVPCHIEGTLGVQSGNLYPVTPL
jgi:hypothetical protein